MMLLWVLELVLVHLLTHPSLHQYFKIFRYSVQPLRLREGNFKPWCHIQITGCNTQTRLFAFISFQPVMTADQFLPTGGPIHVSFPSRLTLEDVQRKNPMVVRGGRYRPPDCEAKHRTAIIIPHRHREHHLKFLLYYLHPFLQRQQLQYGIYIIHQVKHTQQSNTLSLKEQSKGK